MSRVTNAVLCLGLGDADKFEQVQDYFRTTSRPNGFVSVEDDSLPDAWYGGERWLEADLYIGAFNYLDLDALLSHLRAIPWSEPEAVQLLVQEQDDLKFRPINLVESIEDKARRLYDLVAKHGITANAEILNAFSELGEIIYG